jgi:prepilin peptidase CpaA
MVETGHGAPVTETMMTLLQAACLTVFPALVIIAAFSDAVSFTIPNRVSLLLAATFIPAAMSVGQPIGEIGLCLAVGATALVVAIGMFAAGWIGGGDAKLFAASALWLGLPGAPTFLMFTALAGGALALVLMNARTPWFRSYFTSGPGWLARLAMPDAGVPYGVAIAAGALAAFPQSPLMRAFHGSF